MNKIKEYIKRKLKHFLDIFKMQENILEIKTDITKIDMGFKRYKERNSAYLNSMENRLQQQIKHFQQSVNVLHKTVESVVHIGTDIDFYGNHNHSWAVVCIEGKINMIKFVDLSNRKSAMEVLNFLKNFEAGRHCVDAPPRLYFLKDELFKF